MDAGISLPGKQPWIKYLPSPLTAMNCSLLLRSALFAGLLTAGLPLQAQDAPDASEVPAWQMKFENLPPEIRQQYGELVSESSRLFNQKRIFESLNKAIEAENIFDGNPGALNLKGACYVEFRDFTKARKYFEKALVLAPKSPNIVFNLVEMDFVTREWESCEQRIGTLLPMLAKENIPMIRLVEFKLLLAKIKLNKIDEAQALADKYDYLDDSPFYYYAQASMAYHGDKLTEAERWLGSARRVFKDPKTLAPWQDTLIEYGYIKSFYGGDLGDDE